jgi:putative DNA-binding protein
MLTLPELQTGFARAILSEDAGAVAAAVVGDGLTPAARVQVYWNHVFSSLTEALEATFPVVCRLVDRRFFGFAADRYIHAHPPTGPCLFEYGGTFPDFLASFPPCADHPYLADVARLERAMNVALHAPEITPIAPAALGAVPPDEVGRLVFRMDPAVSWLASPWPVDRIWRANQPGADPETPVDLRAGAVRLEIRRQDDAVTMRPLASVEHAFRSRLAGGETLEAVAAMTVAQDASFDLAAALRSLLDEGLIAGFTLAPHHAPSIESTERRGSRG